MTPTITPAWKDHHGDNAFEVLYQDTYSHELEETMQSKTMQAKMIEFISSYFLAKRSKSMVAFVNTGSSDSMMS
jgi:hypothetical protein